jgi:putative membrane protein
MSKEAWDEERIGVPVAGVLPQPRVEAPFRKHEEASEEPTIRPGDTDLGRPSQIPSKSTPLSDEDRRRLQEAREAEALRDLVEAEELLASDPVIVRWAGWFAHPLAAAFLVGTAGALGLFLYSQLLTILANLATQPVGIQYAGYSVLGLLSLAVSYSIIRLMLLYLRLRRNRQLRLEGLEELQTRTRLRWLAAAKANEARSRLEDYLRTYPLETASNQKKLARMAINEASVAKLLLIRDELLDPARLSSTQEWFVRFRDGFQSVLDAAAEERVRYWANRAMIVTAISPNGLVDSVSTSYFSFAMLGDLCTIYNLKAGSTGTAVLLGRVFFNAYLSGQLNDFEKLAEDQYDHLFEQGFQVVGVGMGSNLVTKFLGKVGAKATAGYLNRILLNRLGRYACRLLRPVAKD